MRPWTFFIAVLWFGASAGTAESAQFTVTRLDDPAPNGCAAGDCSLREALIAANDTAGPDLILLGAGIHQISRTGDAPPEEPMSSGILIAKDDVEIRGLGMSQTVLQGSLGLDAVMAATETSDFVPTLHLSDLRIQNFQVPQGAFASTVTALLANLQLTRVELIGNSGPATGAVLAFGSELTIVDSRFIDNAANDVAPGSRAGAILGFFSTISIRGSHFEGNRNEGDGGAINLAGESSLPFGDVVLTNNTFIDNVAVGNGGALWLQAEGGINRIDLGGSRFEGNIAGGDGGAIWFGLGDSAGASTLFEVTAAATVFESNRANGACGAYRFHLPSSVSLLTSATLDIQDSRFVANTAVAGEGGAICHNGSHVILRSTFHGNSAGGNGGAIAHRGGLLDLRQSTLSSNSAGNYGGGIYAAAPVQLRLSTLSANQAANLGGGLYLTGGGASLLRRVTVFSNSAPTGSALRVLYGSGQTTLALDDSILRGSCAASDPLALVDSRQNVESPGDTCGLNLNFNSINATLSALALGPLADNGGPTLTHMPGATSIALNRTLVVPPGCVFVDQRDFVGPGGNCDAGSVERGGYLDTPDIFMDGFE